MEPGIFGGEAVQKGSAVTHRPKGDRTDKDQLLAGVKPHILFAFGMSMGSRDLS
jgi:hypothetical protein